MTEEIENLVNNLLKNRRKTESGCWEWTGYIQHSYGIISFRHRQYRVHRIIFFICFGFDLNSENMILHKCNNRRCFNPTHLKEGDAYDNMKDLAKSGAKRRGKDKIQTLFCREGHTLEFNACGKRFCRICRDKYQEKYREMRQGV